ncbi:MAG TPA: hydroxymethylglutaryl-CoA lyase [Bacteroidia bacterium]|jgi:hydroxymethylglutaryl-CoA lyase|nr:hydroxymethylglutaryl-CoA lyase [Bacteroidia bacterium]
MKIIECPRDAMQGIDEFIPTDLKVKYINSLLKVGYDTIDVGSFVSPKAIPQMRDTAEVLKKIDLTGRGMTHVSALLAIIANLRGAQDAVQFDEISYLGFPFSISETFQKRNTNSTIAESLIRVEEIQNECIRHKKELVVYLSMAFGNPYGDEWSSDIAIHWSHKLHDMGIKIIALSDTIGVSNPENITTLFSALIPELKDVEFGAHLHTTPDKWEEKVNAAYNSGCRRFDAAIKGFGGCPMASDKLTGNMPTENLLSYFKKNNIPVDIDMTAFAEAMIEAGEVFPH